MSEIPRNIDENGQYEKSGFGISNILGWVAMVMGGMQTNEPKKEMPLFKRKK